MMKKLIYLLVVLFVISSGFAYSQANSQTYSHTENCNKVSYKMTSNPSYDNKNMKAYEGYNSYKSCDNGKCVHSNFKNLNFNKNKPHQVDVNVKFGAMGACSSCFNEVTNCHQVKYSTSCY